MKNQLRAYAMVIALIVIWVIFNHTTDGAFLQARNLSNLLRQMAVTGILASGMVLIIVAAQIDLSVGSVAAFLGGLLAVTQLTQDPWIAFLITLLAGIAIGVIHGYLVSYRGIPSFIVTLGSMMAFRGAAMWITDNSTIPLQENWIVNLGTSYLSSNLGWALTLVGLLLVSCVLVSEYRSSPATQNKGKAKLFMNLTIVWALSIGAMWVFSSHEGIPLPVLLMLLLVFIINFFAVRTIWGRHIYATGGNPDAAFLSGIPVKKRTLSVFALMGLLSAIAGVVLTTRVGSASPDAGQLLELDAIAACVIGGTSLMGGKGSVFGAILGAIVIESLNNGMSLANMEPYWQYIIKGLVLVVAVWVDVASREK